MGVSLTVLLCAVLIWHRIDSEKRLDGNCHRKDQFPGNNSDEECAESDLAQTLEKRSFFLALYVYNSILNNYASWSLATFTWWPLEISGICKGYGASAGLRKPAILLHCRPKAPPLLKSIEA